MFKHVRCDVSGSSPDDDEPVAWVRLLDTDCGMTNLLKSFSFSIRHSSRVDIEMEGSMTDETMTHVRSRLMLWMVHS